jgi:hypothetical protein
VTDFSVSLALYLSLGGNNFGKVGAVAVAEALKINGTVTVLA